MQTLLDNDLLDEVRDTRNLVAALIAEIGKTVVVVHRATIQSSRLINLHIDFELEDRAIWMCFNHERKIHICRDFKKHYQREHLVMTFHDASRSTDWLRKLLLGP